MAYAVTYNPTLRIPKTTELTWSELDDNFKNIKLEFDAVQVETVNINASITSLQATVAALSGTSTIPKVLSDLTNVSTTAPTLGQVLAWNGTTWTPSSTSSSSAVPSFDKTNGVLSVTSNAVTNTTNLDGRYVRSVNGVTGDTNGNVTLSITSTMTGTLAARPATATNGIVYVVSGDTATNNGKTYIYVVPTGWQQVVSYDAATNDARYVLKAGDTLTGPLTLAADPTSALQAATKQYVDTKQPLDGTLTALAGFNTNGFMVQTSADNFVGRTLTSTDGTISITNPQGIAGDPVLSVADGSITITKMAAATVVTSVETIASNSDDLKIPTTAAVKAYVDSKATASGTIVNEYAASGTWSKPATVTATSMALIQLWAGGGAGGSANVSTAAAGGGGGGSYKELYVPVSSLAASVAVVVGAGGTATLNTAGGAGGNSSFGSVIAYGGAGGTRTTSNNRDGVGGAGGGLYSAGGGGTAGAFGVVAGNGDQWSGAGGGGGDNATTLPGGSAFRGGAGGGGSSGQSGGLAGVGGSSHLGNGGAGGRNAAAGAGATPACGGGGHTGTTGAPGAGGNGLVRVTVFI